MMLNDDIILAQRVVGLAESNLLSDHLYHSTSGVYIKSNERIDGYQKYLERREKILSVIASGDQILNCILGGTKIIDAFDISVFPKYYLQLKMAALQAIDRDEYVDFFYGNIRPDESFEDIYDRIRVFLEGDYLEFWDSLFNYYEWYDIYNSTLFSSEPVLAANAINQNKYLDRLYYEKMRELIPQVKTMYYEGDIINLSSSFKDRYDLVYLSSIMYYVDLEDYREMLEKFNLTDQGIILTYLYKRADNILKLFNSDKGSVEKIDESDCGLLIYHK